MQQGLELALSMWIVVGMKPITIHPLSLGLGVFLAAGAFVTMGMQSVGGVERITMLTPEQEEILGHMNIVYLDDGQGGTNKTIRVTGVNIQLVNGLDATNGNPLLPASLEPDDHVVNGVGNLIVGYNEEGNYSPGYNRTGSHNILVGAENSASSFGGIVTGFQNTTSGSYACITGGRVHLASGQFSSVSGGYGGIASGTQSTIAGGQGNQALASNTFIGGGIENVAQGPSSAVLSGSQNQAVGVRAVVVGGQFNTASGDGSVVSGGLSRVATGEYDWVAGSLFEDE